MNKITNVRIGKPKGFDLLREATGRINGCNFAAHQYEDHKGGQRGAAPTRWRVYSVTCSGEPWVEFTMGQKTAIARRLNWLTDHCKFCQHEYNATECYSCKFDGGPCRKGKCKKFAP